jgi:hypothetical protein
MQGGRGSIIGVRKLKTAVWALKDMPDVLGHQIKP